MKTKLLTRKQISSVSCPVCGVAVGKRCILIAGGARNEPHGNRKLLAAETVVGEEESDAALLARLKKEFAKPHLAKSVKEKAARQQLTEWNADLE